MKQQIELFAKCTGNDNPSYDNLDKERVIQKGNQLIDFISEEVQEAIDALVDEDIVELLDAWVDQEYFHTQGVLLFERAGIDYKGACNAICENNSLKFTTSAKLAEIWLNEWQSEGNFNYYVSGNEVDGEMYYCLKDLKSGKVKKPKNFEAVKLESFIPEHLIDKHR